MTLALFDLDNTLLAGDSDHLWGQYLVDHDIVDADYYEQQNDRFYREYKEGTLDINEFLAFSLKPLADHSLEQLYSWRHDFIARYIKPLITDKARALVEQHRAKEDTLMVITATNRFVTERIVAEFNIPNLLATEPEQSEHGYTGKVAGTPCFQEGKVTRLNAWLQEHNESLDNAWFYSDSHNDLPLLKQVENPVAVDPDETLLKHAQTTGWPVISLRN